MKLENRVVVITGAASGIGLASARLFAREGARVVMSDLPDSPGASAAEAIRAAGGQAVFQACDVREEEQVRALIDGAVERFGRLDAQFNNAGIYLAKSVVDSTVEEFDRIVAINLRGVFLGCKYALPHLIAGGGGVILNTSSNGGLIGRPGDPVYTATKHGVMGLTKSLALAHAHQRIRVNAVCPGPIDTPLVAALQQPGQEREAFVRSAVASCPTPRLASPDEVASAALFLISDDSSFVTGVGLAVDGGKAAGTFPSNRYRLDFELL